MQLVGSVLYDADELVVPLVEGLIPHVGEGGFGPCRALGVVRGDILLGGVVFHNHKGPVIEMSGAFTRPDWIRPSTVRRILNYPYNDLGIDNLITITPKSNKRARQIDEFLGFRVAGTIKHAFGKDDAIIYQLPREYCRWIKE